MSMERIIRNWCKASHYDRPVGYDIDYSNHKEQAMEIIDQEGFLDIDEYEDYVHLNAFSENDMW